MSRGRACPDRAAISPRRRGPGSFNHRFAQPSRDAHRYSAFFYPTDIYPFAGRALTDRVTGESDGLFAHDDTHLPRIFFTNTGYEYWGRAASLLHTDPSGERDVEPLPNERIYHLASGQHFVGRFPPTPEARLPGSFAYRGNPLNFLVTMRSLLVRMVEWIRDAKEPPSSVYPRITEGTLVPFQQVNFPDIPGVRFPGVAHEAYRVDYGPRLDKGIIDRQPPELGLAFRSLVPQVDTLGNELGGVLNVEILAPLATYTPWNLRVGYPGATHELTDYLGTYIPLARDEVERRSTGDPRPSIEALYEEKEAYLEAARRAAASLERRGLLLAEDKDDVIRRASRHWDWIVAAERD